MGYGHSIARFFNWSRLEHVLGIGFIIVKVGLLLTLEVLRTVGYKFCRFVLHDLLNLLGNTASPIWLYGYHNKNHTQLTHLITCGITNISIIFYPSSHVTQISHLMISPGSWFPSSYFPLSWFPFSYFPFSWFPFLMISLQLFPFLMISLSHDFPFSSFPFLVISPNSWFHQAHDFPLSWFPFLMISLSHDSPLVITLSHDFPFSWFPFLMISLSHDFPFSWYPILTIVSRDLNVFKTFEKL